MGSHRRQLRGEYRVRALDKQAVAGMSGTSQEA